MGRLTANLFLKQHATVASQTEFDRYLDEGGITCEQGLCSQLVGGWERANPVSVLW